MPDIQVNVNVDGKTVFVHGVAGTPDATSAVCNALRAATAHFEALRTPPAPIIVSAAAQNLKGPSL